MTEPLRIPKHIRRRLTLTEWLRFRRIDRNQIFAEQNLNSKGVDFRGTGAESAKENYGKMDQKEFETINARQQWVNWILIGKCLHNRVPNRPLTVLDIGCGTGTSTAVLATYLPPGSNIIANDITPSLIKAAKQKRYTCAHTNTSLSPEFVVQDAMQPFHRADQSPIENDVLDYVNTSGIVGHHLTEKDFVTMAKNVSTITKPGGYAAIDEGPVLGEEKIVATMLGLGWNYLRPVRILPWKKRGQLLFQLPK